MPYIEVDHWRMEEDWSMSRLHSHSYYEIYFLLNGERQFFFEKSLLHVPKNSMVIIPPFQNHKTEGGPFERINIYADAKYLNSYELNVLSTIGKDFILFFSDRQITELTGQLRTLVTASKKMDKNGQLLFRTLLGYLFYTLECFYKIAGSLPVDMTVIEKKTSSLALKIIEYLNKHFQNKITMSDITETFYISKTALYNQFYESTGTSVMDYLMQIRISEAKRLLLNTKKSVEEISTLTGFSSANYFGLMFKQKVGLSPLNYRSNN